MRRISHLVYAAALIAGAASSSGCADNESVLFVKGVMVVKPPECSVVADSSATTWLAGAFDNRFPFA